MCTYIYKYLICAFNYPIPANAESWHWWWHPVCWHHPSPRKHGWVWSQPRASWTTCDCEHLGSSMGSGLRLTFQTKITLLNGKGEPFNFDVNQPIPKNKIFKDAKRSTRLNQTQELSIEDTSMTGRITHEVDLGIRPSRESFQQWNWDQTLLEGISPTNLGFNQPYKPNIHPIYIPYQSSCSYLRLPNMAILPGENCSAELVVAQENSSVGPWIKSLGPELPQKNLAKGCWVPKNGISS